VKQYIKIYYYSLKGFTNQKDPPKENAKNLFNGFPLGGLTGKTKRKSEFAAFAYTAGNPDFSALGFDEFLGDGETQAGPGAFLGAGHFKVPVENAG